MPDTETIFRWVEELAGLGRRGTPAAGDDRSAEYLLERFRGFGLSDVQVQESESFRWRATGVGLGVDGVEIAVSPAVFSFDATVGNGSFSTGPDGLAASLEDVGDGTVEQFERADVRGRTVVFDLRFTLPRDALLAGGEFFHDPHDTVDPADLKTANPYMSNFDDVVRRAIDGGAVGFVGVLADYFDSNDFHPEYTEGVSIPGVWVTRAEGARLRSLLAPGRDTGAVLRLEGERAAAPARTVIGYLPGRSSDTIMVQSHHDSIGEGAVEDASGTASVLALAAHYSGIPAEERPKTLMFVLMDSHWTGYQAHQAFVDAFVAPRDLDRRIVANVTVEHIAKQAEIGPDGGLVVFDKPEYRGVFENVSPALKAVIEAAIVENGLERTLRLPADEIVSLLGELPTDADLVYQAGVPTVSLISAPIYLYDKADTLDKVMKSDLAPVARAFIQIIDALAATPSDRIRV